MTEEKRTEYLLELWKTTVSVQQHFNDLELRIRNYAVTIMVGVMGIVALAVKEGMVVTFFCCKVQVGSLMLLAGSMGWTAFYLMDGFWYHRLLYGAVKHGQLIERSLKEQLPEAELTTTIGRESPIRLFGRTMHTTGKMDLFYGLGLALLWLSAFLLQFGAVSH